VLCISKWAKAPGPEERDAILPKEVRATLKLYLDGVIEQMWFKLDAPGVVFLVNAESVDAAKTHVHGLRPSPKRAARRSWRRTLGLSVGMSFAPWPGNTCLPFILGETRAARRFFSGIAWGIRAACLRFRPGEGTGRLALAPHRKTLATGGSGNTMFPEV